MRSEDCVKSLVVAHIFRKPIYFRRLDCILQELIDTDKLEKWICPFCNRKFSSPYALSSHLFNTVKPSECSRKMNLVMRKAAELYREWKATYSKYRISRYSTETLIQFLRQKNVREYREQSR